MPSKSHQLILEHVTTILQRTGYSIIQLPLNKKACFDILARKKDTILIIKIAPYIDSFTRDNAYELNNIAQFLNASPLIIGIKGRRFDEIDEGLVLLRYGIPVISPETFLSMMIH
ncbi:MAG: transcriptional regulator, partial [Candidatus Heimdallarchaeaceae archaeon]